MTTTIWLEVREPGTNRLLFKFDPNRLLIESICSFWDGDTKQRKRFRVVTDLTQFLTTPPEPASPSETPESSL
jgi:hypothetical protein